MISFENVSVSAHSDAGIKPILKNVSAQLSESKIAIIGSNGSGKSTLVRLVNGLIDASAGRVSVHVGGSSLHPVGDARLIRQNVGFIFTNPNAQVVMPTPLEDVELSLKRTVKNRHERRQAALESLAKFGLSELAEQSVHSLSGGQLQLLAIASVLATNPQILVADEPTTLLDLKNSILLTDLLMGLPQQVLVATHDLDLARRCERVLVMSEGEVIFDGSPEPAIEFYRGTV